MEVMLGSWAGLSIMRDRLRGPRALARRARRGAEEGATGNEYRSWEGLVGPHGKDSGKLTLIERPWDLYSSRSGRMCSASMIVETMMFAGPGPGPTCKRVSSVV